MRSGVLSGTRAAAARGRDRARHSPRLAVGARRAAAGRGATRRGPLVARRTARARAVGPRRVRRADCPRAADRSARDPSGRGVYGRGGAFARRAARPRALRARRVRARGALGRRTGRALGPWRVRARRAVGPRRVRPRAARHEAAAVQLGRGRLAGARRLLARELGRGNELARAHAAAQLAAATRQATVSSSSSPPYSALSSSSSGSSSGAGPCSTTNQPSASSTSACGPISVSAGAVANSTPRRAARRSTIRARRPRTRTRCAGRRAAAARRRRRGRSTHESRLARVELDPALVLLGHLEPDHLAVEGDGLVELLGAHDGVATCAATAPARKLGARLHELHARCPRDRARAPCGRARPRRSRPRPRRRATSRCATRGSSGFAVIASRNSALPPVGLRAQHERGAAHGEVRQPVIGARDLETELLLVERALSRDVGGQQQNAVQAAHDGFSRCPQSRFSQTLFT